MAQNRIINTSSPLTVPRAATAQETDHAPFIPPWTSSWHFRVHHIVTPSRTVNGTRTGLLNPNPTMTMARLNDKVALVTGAAGGIGSAVARAFVGQGARVHLVDLQEEPLVALANSLGALASYSLADVSDENATRTYIADALALQARIDIAFLNAGIVGAVSRIEATPNEVFDRVMRVNVRGVWLGLAGVLPMMRAQGGGSIVVTSSIAGTRGTAGQCAYVASKHAVLGLMKTAALEGAPHRIRVNAICPAPIDTEMMQALAAGIDPDDHEAGKRKVLSAIPLGRYGTADEVAKLVMFLSGDDSSYCTGAAYMIDGGGTAGPVR